MTLPSSRYYADGFAALPLDQKILAWHLYQAAIAGRDIYYDQRYRHALEMREILEEIVINGDDVDPATMREIWRYTKLFWINSGPHNNMTSRKFVLKCAPEAFRDAAEIAEREGAQFPRRPGESVAEMCERLRGPFFDPAVDPLVTNKSPAGGADVLAASANNLYEGVTMADLEGFQERYGLNSRLVKRDGALIEEVCRLKGRYGRQIRSHRAASPGGAAVCAAGHAPRARGADSLL